MIVNLSAPQNNYLERTDTLKRYCDDIKYFRPLTIEEEQKLIEIYHTTNSKVEKEKVKNELLCANQRFALGVARRWATNDNLMDLISEANIGMVEALEEYDLKQKVRFITFAVYYIRRAINNYMIRNNDMVRKNNAAKTFHLLSQVTNSFMQKECRQPTTDELVEILNKDYGADIRDSSDVMNIQMASIDDHEENEEEANFGNIITFNALSSSINECETESDKEFAKQMVTSVLRKLKPIEQEVIKYLFGIGHMREYEMREVADKMNFSAERIRQIRNTALDKMKNEYLKLAESI